MKIAEIKLSILERPGGGEHRLVQVPGLRRIQYTHKGFPTSRPEYHPFLIVRTDDGIESIAQCTQGVGQAKDMVDLLRGMAIGEDPFRREHFFQKFEVARRWLYRPYAWSGAFDHCLWDIAGQATNQPVYNLLGKVRDRIAVYLMGGDTDLDGYKRHIDQGREDTGIFAYKIHSYKGGKADVPIIRGLREYVGPDYDLINDPVRSYTLEEAIMIGRLMEELDYVWLEEPIHEENILQLQELCAALVMPVMGEEPMQADMEGSCQRLLLKATDLIRATGVHGVTQTMKTANFAQCYGANIELNGHGGLFGAVNTHMQMAITNTTFHEVGGDGRGLNKMAQELGAMNAPVVKDGYIAPPDGPGFGIEWDMKQFRRHLVEEY